MVLQLLRLDIDKSFCSTIFSFLVSISLFIFLCNAKPFLQTCSVSLSQFERVAESIQSESECQGVPARPSD